MNQPQPRFDLPEPPQPALNIPPVIVVLVVLLVGIHFVFENLLGVSQRITVLLDFAFIPERYDGVDFGVPVMAGAKVWSFLTYAFLHADWAHLITNVVWMVAFGSPLARRFGAMRFLLFSAICAIAGAALHLAGNLHDAVPVVGASAAISGQMAGASRFVFNNPRGFGAGLSADEAPASSLIGMFTDRRILIFLGVWFGLNLLFGLGFGLGADMTVAWEAHIGGFLAGLLLFPLFDPVGPGRKLAAPAEEPEDFA